MTPTRIPEANREEIKKFVALLHKLDEEKQMGLYLMLQGAAVVAGNKEDIFS